MMLYQLVLLLQTIVGKKLHGVKSGEDELYNYFNMKAFFSTSTNIDSSAHYEFWNILSKEPGLIEIKNKLTSLDELVKTKPQGHLKKISIIESSDTVFKKLDEGFDKFYSCDLYKNDPNSIRVKTFLKLLNHLQIEVFERIECLENKKLAASQPASRSAFQPASHMKAIQERREINPETGKLTETKTIALLEPSKTAISESPGVIFPVINKQSFGGNEEKELIKHALASEQISDIQLAAVNDIAKDITGKIFSNVEKHLPRARRHCSKDFYLFWKFIKQECNIVPIITDIFKAKAAVVRGAQICINQAMLKLNDKFDEQKEISEKYLKNLRLVKAPATYVLNNVEGVIGNDVPNIINSGFRSWKEKTHVFYAVLLEEINNEFQKGISNISQSNTELKALSFNAGDFKHAALQAFLEEKRRFENIVFPMILLEIDETVLKKFNEHSNIEIAKNFVGLTNTIINNPVLSARVSNLKMLGQSSEKFTSFLQENPQPAKLVEIPFCKTVFFSSVDKISAAKASNNQFIPNKKENCNLSDGPKATNEPSSAKSRWSNKAADTKSLNSRITSIASEFYERVVRGKNRVLEMKSSNTDTDPTILLIVVVIALLAVLCFLDAEIFQLICIVGIMCFLVFLTIILILLFLGSTSEQASLAFSS